jgi:YfiR/HmsC-like
MALLICARSWLAGAAAAAVACGAAAAAGQRSGTAEADIKAAFLFNFTKFVEWPATAPAGPFQICTLADAAFDSVLVRTLTGESTDGRPIVRSTPEGPEFARTCHILFISRAENLHADRWMAAVRGQPVLVVVESKSAEDAGAHITFVIDDNRVKFDVDDDAASRAGLKISSKLLRVARHVTARSQ